MHHAKTGVFLFIFVLTCGCDQSSQVREYQVARAAGEVLTSDELRGQFKAIPFRWNAPKDWRETENDQFSSFAWVAGPKGEEARITVSDLPAGAGVEPQFIRWQGQLKIPETASADVMKSVEELPLGETKGRWIEIKGESETILGMIAPYKNKLWVVKYRGPNSTAADQRDAFRSFCESFKAG